MPNRGAATYTPGTINQTIADGYHNGLGSVAGDSDLAASNIVSGVNLFGVVGTAGTAASPVPRTGQTISYGARDDGALEIGAVLPTPRFTVNVDSNGDGDCDDPGEACDGTVTDNLTRLIWLKDANCFGTQTWGTALSYVNTLNSGECSLSDGSNEGDWRLPNVRELFSLVDFSQRAPALPTGHPFVAVGFDRYWTSTTRKYDTAYAYYLDIYGNGYIGANYKSNIYFVWPVRGGP
jgi:hypothetical protein